MAWYAYPFWAWVIISTIALIVRRVSVRRARSRTGAPPKRWEPTDAASTAVDAHEADDQTLIPAEPITEAEQSVEAEHPATVDELVEMPPAAIEAPITAASPAVAAESESATIFDALDGLDLPPGFAPVAVDAERVDPFKAAVLASTEAAPDAAMAKLIESAIDVGYSVEKPADDVLRLVRGRLDVRCTVAVNGPTYESTPAHATVLEFSVVQPARSS